MLHYLFQLRSLSIRTGYLSVLKLDGFVFAMEDVDCPLVVILQWCSHNKLFEPISIHVRYLSQR